MTITVGLSAKYVGGIDGADSMDPESGIRGSSGTRWKKRPSFKLVIVNPEVSRPVVASGRKCQGSSTVKVK